MTYQRILTLAFATSVLATLPAQAQDDAAEPGDGGAITVLDQVVPVAEESSGGDTDAVQTPAGELPGDDAARVGPLTDDAETSGLTEREILGLEFNRFQELKAAGMLDEAENTAKRVIEMSINLSGPDSNDTAKALNNLATVQYSEQEYDLAQQNFQAAIDIFTDNEDRLSSQLINPLKGLGAAQLEGGRPDLAERTFQQAAHITQVNEGPHNVEQIPILEALAETNLRMGELEDAKNTQDMIYMLSLRHLGDDPMAMIPPLQRRAAWQRRTGYILDERATYRRIIRIVEDAKGKDDMSLIRPLTRLAESYFYVDTSEPTTFQAATIATGEMYFKRAVRIAEENPESDWKTVAATKVSLADYYNIRSDQGRARRAYGDVWDLLSDNEERLSARHEALEVLRPLKADPLPAYTGGASQKDRVNLNAELREGSFVIAYDVSSRGRVSNVEVIERIPAEFEDLEQRVVRAVRGRIYRPMFEDGHAVDSPNQVLTHKFFYHQSALDDLRAKVEAE